MVYFILPSVQVCPFSEQIYNILFIIKTKNPPINRRKIGDYRQKLPVFSDLTSYSRLTETLKIIKRME